MKYIGNTLNHLKTRTNQYFNNIVKLVNKKIYLDSFTYYFANHFKNRETTIKAADVCDITKVRILALYNPITISKCFRTDNYQLYM